MMDNSFWGKEKGFNGGEEAFLHQSKAGLHFGIIG